MCGERMARIELGTSPPHARRCGDAQSLLEGTLLFVGPAHSVEKAAYSLPADGADFWQVEDRKIRQFNCYETVSIFSNKWAYSPISRRSSNRRAAEKSSRRSVADGASEWRRRGPVETESSISVRIDRIRRNEKADAKESGQIGAPGRARTCDPRLRRPCVQGLKTGLNLQPSKARLVISGGYIQASSSQPRRSNVGHNSCELAMFGVAGDNRITPTPLNYAQYWGVLAAAAVARWSLRDFSEAQSMVAS
jgi:hypothetical protein